MLRRSLLLFATVLVAGAASAQAEDARKAVLYKNPQCGCCEGYAAYLRGNGFDVTVKPTNDLTMISQNAGIPERLQGCHTMFIDGYVIDGHVPVDIVRRLLAERPPVKGITLLLWGGPVALMLLGLFLLQRYLRRRATRINAEEQPLSAEESSRADALLKEINPK